MSTMEASNLQYLTGVTSDVQNQINNCAITGVVSAVGGALLGATAAGLMVSSMGTMKGGGPLEIDGDMDYHKTYKFY